jgi:hypothetical protein
VTAATKPLPPHGTSARAKGRPASGIKGCHCDACRHAEYLANKAREVAALAGRPATIDATLVAAHIKKLIKAGATAHGIGVAARTHTHTVQLIHCGVRTTTRATTAKRILAVTIDAALNNYELRVDSTKSLRQIQALMAAGHSVTAIRNTCEPAVERTTVSTLLNGKLSRIRACTAAAIDVGYQRLSMHTGTSAKSRLRAERAGWAVPAAWDGIDMSDPDAFPDLTGHCGTTQGYQAHRGSGIPACRPCKDAEAAASAERKAKRATAARQELAA